MNRLYTIFAYCALVIFAWAQYHGYGLFDHVATGQASAQPGGRSIYHK
jgi:hypothetical protein